MARSRDYWFQQILAEKARQPTLDSITSTSKVSTFGAIAFVISFIAFLLDSFFDILRGEVSDKLLKEKAHGPAWYKTLALNFQYGQTFNRDLGKYENIGLTDAQVAAQKVVVQAAVTEVDGSVRIKVVRDVAGDYAPLDAAQKASFDAYIDKGKDAGVKVISDSLPPDSLKLNMEVFYDPLVLKADGSRIDGMASAPVTDEIIEFLKGLPLNGEFANTRLTDRLQQVEGVVFPVIKSSFAKYGLFPFTLIDEKYIPDAGYLRIEPGDLVINYRPYV